mgnify:CR=1 FL=1
MTKAHFGVMVPQIKRSWQEARDAGIAFEEMGFDSLWVNDHLYGPTSPEIPMIEAWTLIAGLAAVTEKVELGTLVTPAGMRNPQHQGKVHASVDNVAGRPRLPGPGPGRAPTHAAPGARQPLFIERPGGRLFAIHHPPHCPASGAGPSGAAVVYVHPFAEEMNQSRRMATLQAEAQAGRGHGGVVASFRATVRGLPDARFASWLGASALPAIVEQPDRKSTRLNSSHVVISYAVCCLKKKK